MSTTTTAKKPKFQNRRPGNNKTGNAQQHSPALTGGVPTATIRRSAGAPESPSPTPTPATTDIAISSSQPQLQPQQLTSSEPLNMPPRRLGSARSSSSLSRKQRQAIQAAFNAEQAFLEPDDDAFVPGIIGGEDVDLMSWPTPSPMQPPVQPSMQLDPVVADPTVPPGPAITPPSAPTTTATTATTTTAIQDAVNAALQLPALRPVSGIIGLDPERPPVLASTTTSGAAIVEVAAATDLCLVLDENRVIRIYGRLEVIGANGEVWTPPSSATVRIERERQQQQQQQSSLLRLAKYRCGLASTTLVASTDVVLKLWEKETEPDGDGMVTYDPLTGFFTVTRSGLYLLHASGLSATPVLDVEGSCYVNFYFNTTTSIDDDHLAQLGLNASSSDVTSAPRNGLALRSLTVFENFEVGQTFALQAYLSVPSSASDRVIEVNARTAKPYLSIVRL